jgi:hypothetical protein
VLQQEKPRTREFMGGNNSRTYHHRTADPRDVPQTSGQANIEEAQIGNRGDEEEEDEDDDPFE